MMFPNISNRVGARLLSAIALLAVAFSLVACATTKPHPNANPSLVEVNHNQSFDRVLLRAPAVLPSFNRVFIEPAQVSLSDYWLRDRRGDYTDRDIERIKRDYGKLLDKALNTAFEKSGKYQLVDVAADADVIVRPALESLNIYAPDLSFRGRIDQYIIEAGNATFNVTISDAKSGAALAQFIDHRETFSNAGQIREKADRITNARYFSRLMDRWSNNLLAILTNPDSVSAR